MLAATPRFSSSDRCGDAFGIVMVSGSLFLLWGHCMQYLDYMSIELYTINRTRSHPTALQKQQSHVDDHAEYGRDVPGHIAQDAEESAITCGRWLACDADNAAHQVHRAAASAGKPAPTRWNALSTQAFSSCE